MKGNVGEWSELYTMFKLLADGKLYAADADTANIDEAHGIVLLLRFFKQPYHITKRQKREYTYL